MSRTQDLLADLKANAAGADKIEQTIAELVTSIAKNQRALKSRKRYLWLSGDGTEINPAITGKNDTVRTAQHEAICAEDVQARAIRGFLDVEEATLNIARATLAGTKRDINIIETELATIRAELNARAAEAFGKLATSNGTGLPWAGDPIPCVANDAEINARAAATIEKVDAAMTGAGT